MAELRARLTFTEFLDWISYLDQIQEEISKEDYYLAQIAAEIRRGHVLKPKSVKTEDFFVKWASEPILERMKRSKEAWAMGLGIKLGKN